MLWTSLLHSVVDQYRFINRIEHRSIRERTYARLTVLLIELYQFNPKLAPTLISDSKAIVHIKYMATSRGSFSIPQRERLLGWLALLHNNCSLLIWLCPNTDVISRKKLFATKHRRRVFRIKNPDKNLTLPLCGYSVPFRPPIPDEAVHWSRIIQSTEVNLNSWDNHLLYALKFKIFSGGRFQMWSKLSKDRGRFRYSARNRQKK